MLLAYLCRNDFSHRLVDHGCPSPKVRTRVCPETWDGLTYCPTADGPELDKICLDCPAWEPLYDKPLERIADACGLAESALCPRWPTVRRSGVASPVRVARMDAFCRLCRFFVPG